MHIVRIIISALMLAFSLDSYSQTGEWLVVAEDAGRENPVEINPRNISVGKSVYINSCAACHGAKADGKGLLASADLISDTVQNQTDGTIFYKIKSGRNKMPPFKGILSDNEIWSVINYLRILVNPSSLPPAKDLKIELTANDVQKTITAFIRSADSLKQPLTEIDVHFYIERDFGLLQLGQETNFSGNDGKVTVLFPDNIIGDFQGNVTILSKVENSFLYNDATVTVEQKWGMPLKTEDEIFSRRSLWGSRDKSPVWLLLLANGILAAVWGVIIYIIINLLKIKKAGKIFFK
ncbi:MAG: cytochrome c [Bacteroidales bacterium]|nr:cytochrome c [Bacteroidales bacterium]